MVTWGLESKCGIEEAGKSLSREWPSMDSWESPDGRLGMGLCRQVLANSVLWKQLRP